MKSTRSTNVQKGDKPAKTAVKPPGRKFELQAPLAPRRKKILLIFWGGWHILPRGLIGFLTKIGGRFLNKKMGYRWELVGVFGSNVPLASLKTSSVSPHRKKFPHAETEPNLGKNRPKHQTKHQVH